MNIRIKMAVLALLVVLAGCGGGNAPAPTSSPRVSNHPYLPTPASACVFFAMHPTGEAAPFISDPEYPYQGVAGISVMIPGKKIEETTKTERYIWIVGDTIPYAEKASVQTIPPSKGASYTTLGCKTPGDFAAYLKQLSREGYRGVGKGIHYYVDAPSGESVRLVAGQRVEGAKAQSDPNGMQTHTDSPVLSLDCEGSMGDRPCWAEYEGGLEFNEAYQ